MLLNIQESQNTGKNVFIIMCLMLRTCIIIQHIFDDSICMKLRYSIHRFNPAIKYVSEITSSKVLT